MNIYNEVLRILHEKGKEAALDYIHSLTEEQQGMLMDRMADIFDMSMTIPVDVTYAHPEQWGWTIIGFSKQ